MDKINTYVSETSNLDIPNNWNTLRQMTDEQLRLLFSNGNIPTNEDHIAIIDSKVNKFDTYTREELEGILQAYFANSPEIAKDWYDKEMERRTSEVTRKSDETVRQSQESTRQTQETTRVNGENIRKSNETTRQQTLQSMNTLKGQVETLKTQTEQVKNDTLTVKNDTLAVKNATDTVRTDTLIVKNDTLAVKSATEIVKNNTENTRVATETAKTNAESKIVDCESRMKTIENEFGSLVSGTGFATKTYVDTELLKKEPVINTKNTAFNVNFETTATNIKMNGFQHLGSLTTVARADHVHPADTTKVATSRTVNGKPLSANITLTMDDVSDGTTRKLANYSLTTHTHTKSNITDFSHTHPMSDITGLSLTASNVTISDSTNVFDARDVEGALLENKSSISTLQQEVSGARQTLINESNKIIDLLVDIPQVKIGFQATKGDNVLYLRTVTDGWDCVIEWGDGTTTEVKGNGGTITHNYGVANYYEITIINPTKWGGLQVNSNAGKEKYISYYCNVAQTSSSMSYMFRQCINLNSVVIKNTSNITNTSYMFSGCTSLTQIPNLDITNVTNMTEMYGFSTNIQSTVEPGKYWANPNVTSYSRCFYNCTKIPNYAEIPASWK